jgi:hypothetical protein
LNARPFPHQVVPFSHPAAFVNLLFRMTASAETLEGSIVYNVDRWSSERVEQWAGDFREFIAAACSG